MSIIQLSDYLPSRPDLLKREAEIAGPYPKAIRFEGKEHVVIRYTAEGCAVICVNGEGRVLPAGRWEAGQ